MCFLEEEQEECFKTVSISTVSLKTNVILRETYLTIKAFQHYWNLISYKIANKTTSEWSLLVVVDFFSLKQTSRFSRRHQILSGLNHRDFNQACLMVLHILHQCPSKYMRQKNKKLLTEVIHLLDHLGEHLKWLLKFHHFQSEGYLCRQKLQSQILVLNPLQQKQIQ